MLDGILGRIERCCRQVEGVPWWGWGMRSDGDVLNMVFGTVTFVSVDVGMNVGWGAQSAAVVVLWDIQGTSRASEGLFTTCSDVKVSSDWSTGRTDSEFFSLRYFLCLSLRSCFARSLAARIACSSLLKSEIFDFSCRSATCSFTFPLYLLCRFLRCAFSSWHRSLKNSRAWTSRQNRFCCDNIEKVFGSWN